VQHFTLLPLCVIFGRVNFYAESFAYAVRHRVWADFLGMLVYWTWYGAMLRVLPSWTHVAVFFAASHIVVGVLHVQLLISHLATRVLTEEEEKEAQFFRFQLLTSRNIESHWYSHWFHGGLENQIEHHLFPQMPRHNLRRISPFVRAICAKHNIRFESIGFFAAVAKCLANFRKIAHELMFLDV
jgi:delta8-fatty-acid desaturase